MTQITPELLRKAWFKPLSLDHTMWHKVGFIEVKLFYGRCTINLYPSSRIPDMETLSTLHEILTGEKLNW